MALGVCSLQERWLSTLAQPIFLQPAVRLVRNGAFDELGLEGWVEVVFSEGFSMRKLELLHAVSGAQWA